LAILTSSSLLSEQISALSRLTLTALANQYDMDRKGFLHRILFLDIETVSLKANFEELSLREQLLFEKKTAYKRKGGEPTSELYKNAAIWAEFGKVICISTATLKSQEKVPEIVLKSFYGDDERQVLTDFKLFLVD